MGEFGHDSGGVACFTGNLRMPLESTPGAQTEIEVPRVPTKKNKPNHPVHEKVGFSETAVSFQRQTGPWREQPVSPRNRIAPEKREDSSWSAPAAYSRGAAYRGTFDRGVWRKPLAFAADAAGYGY